MRISQSLLATALCLAAFGQTTPDVGSGSPNLTIQQAFVQAFFRNGFSNLVSLPPIATVKSFGATGLIQEFADAAKSQTNRYALIKPNVNVPATLTGYDVLQVYAPIYAYYTSSGLGPNNAGYPLADTANCPGLASISNNSCLYQLFDKPYALFVYKSDVLAGGANFATRDPFYTKWQSLGGIGLIGPATTAETAVTAVSGIAATLQTFDMGAVFNITSGTLAGRLVGIGPAVFAAYSAAGGYAGFLGLPISDETIQPNGSKRQNFEGGFIDYVVGSPAVIHRSIQDIIIAPATALKLNLGDSMTLTATPYDAIGNSLADRPVVWSTSNGRVVSLQPNGQKVVITAIGGGTAAVTASAEGKSSTPVNVTVSAPCCALGEGAPTPAIQQAFQDAAMRNRLAIQLPAPTSVQRLGGGYVQNLQDANGASVLIAIADASSTAYVLTGVLLSKYLDLGGPSGALGYPISDATPGGRQIFQNQAALAGNPVQSVTGAFLNKWAALNYENGVAGPPTSAVSTVLSFRATSGSVQSYRNGVFVLTQTGPSSGKVFFASGLILAAYNQAGGAAGSLGLPLNDEYVSGAKRQQDFEGGSVDYSPGDAAAIVHPGDRRPLVTANPTQPLAGSRIHLAIGGFDPGSTVRVSVSGQADFSVKTDTGAYVWDAAIPSSAKAGTVAIHAVDVSKASASADGSYTIRSPSQVVFQITKISGDGQTGIPGSALPQPLRILVKDDSGNPAPGLAVSFSASPGARITAAATTTDANGLAEAILRLPVSDGLALATATAGRQVVTFNAQAAHSSLQNFPNATQSAPGGSMVASVAAILQYYQNRGELPSTNGFADAQTLTQFLKTLCVPDAQGSQVCDGFVLSPDSPDQFVNLWRLGSFVNGALDVSIEKADLATVRDFLGQGDPLLLALTGSHFVAATGVASDGIILTMNPDPAFIMGNLANSLSGVVRLIPRAPALRGFLITSSVPITIIGSCGATLQLAPSLYMQACDGQQNLYELDLNSTSSRPALLAVTDLGTPTKRVDLAGSQSSAFTISRAGAQWTAAPTSLNFTSAGIVNAASFTPGLAPGGLFTAFGSGLSQAGTNSTIEISGSAVPVVAQFPFQISGQIPLELAPGTYQMRITSPYGAMEQPVTIRPVAPAIFLVTERAGAILNQNGTLNTPDNPAPRGQAIVIYSTGLGAVVNQGTLRVARTPVIVILQGAELKPFFAGLAPGFIGLYQINVIVPLSTPPGLSLSLSVRQNDFTSNPVEVAIQ